MTDKNTDSNEQSEENGSMTRQGQTVWVLEPRPTRRGQGLRSTDPWASDDAPVHLKIAIRAATEDDARELATKMTLVEHFVGEDVWGDARLTTCTPIDEYGSTDEILISDAGVE